ncbi:MAG TPA: hypothetical protein PKZ84_04940 [Anaerolineae bacterium]|nr:hypothetical protein [Anaerolineae bacterium]HQI83802.1 hypothetical protein [Anaerolineae bacterium]
MEAIREIRTVEQEEIILRLPQAFWGRQVEIIVLSTPSPDKMRFEKKSLRGCLQSYARPELISTESSAWLDAVEENYAAR